METSKDFDVNENLILANIIWNEWKKIQEKNGVKVGRMPAIIPQEVLLEIKSLKIPKGIVKIENGKGAQVLAETNGLETLKGIEKLENLENFSCVGSYEYVLQSEISTHEQYYQLMSRSETWKQNLEKEIKYVKKNIMKIN